MPVDLDMKKNLTIIAGKDPLEETGGGHSSYVRALGDVYAEFGFTPSNTRPQ
jgi:hypothetical protein